MITLNTEKCGKKSQLIHDKSYIKEISCCHSYANYCLLWQPSKALSLIPLTYFLCDVVYKAGF